MNKLNTINNGGHPIELDDLRWMDSAYRNAFLGLLSGFGILPNETFILSGCNKTTSGSTITVTEGYICLEGEILYMPEQTYPVPTGSDVDYFELDVTYDPLGNETFEDTTTHDTYEIRQAKISVGTPASGTITLLSNVKTIFEVIKDNIPAIHQSTIDNDQQDFLIQSNTNNITGLVYQLAIQATELLLGRIKLATQSETDTGTDDSKAITPFKLKNTAYLPKKLESATIYIGSISSGSIIPLVSVTFPSVGTANYRIVAYVHTTNSQLAHVGFNISNQSPTGFDVLFRNLDSVNQANNLYFFYTIYKNH